MEYTHSQIMRMVHYEHYFKTNHTFLMESHVRFQRMFLVCSILVKNNLIASEIITEYHFYPYIGGRNGISMGNVSQIWNECLDTV